MENEMIFLSPHQAAELLGVSIQTIYKWVQGRQVPYRKHGKLIKFKRQDLLEWSKQREIKPYAEVS